MRRESLFQADLIKRLYNQYPEAIILKNDPNYLQGIPDLLVLYKDKWALLECKRSANEVHQENQDYYVEKADRMSFSRFIYPENMEEVLRELQQTFRPEGEACVAEPQSAKLAPL